MAAIDSDIVPSYKKFAAFVRTEYAPHGRTDPGVWALPDGAARYRFAIRHMTTTELSPEQIHEIGVKELAETEAEMLTLAHQLGFKDLASLNQHIKEDRTFYATSGEQVLDLYTKYTRQMEKELPKLFNRLPKNKLVVIPMDSFRSQNAVPADYTQGAPDGSRPGRINVNQYGPTQRLVLNIEAIAYHEGVPGHHLQISIGQELAGLPDFRRNGEYTAFVEGWALYSERLGKEVGFYQDPYSDYGRLENEMWRCIRLVIDTGVHEKHWSRDQMVEYFHRYTAMDEPNVQTEVDRYISWPGQALAYKLGQLEILELRQEAGKSSAPSSISAPFTMRLWERVRLPFDVLDSTSKPGSQTSEAITLIHRCLAFNRVNLALERVNRELRTAATENWSSRTILHGPFSAGGRTLIGEKRSHRPGNHVYQLVRVSTLTIEESFHMRRHPAVATLIWFCAFVIALAAPARGQEKKPKTPPTPGPMLGQGTMDLDTPDFTLSLVRSSQTVAALKPKGAGGFDFTPGDLLVERSQTDTSTSATLTFACALERLGWQKLFDFLLAHAGDRVAHLKGCPRCRRLTSTLPSGIPLQIIFAPGPSNRENSCCVSR